MAKKFWNQYHHGKCLPVLKASPRGFTVSIWSAQVSNLRFRPTAVHLIINSVGRKPTGVLCVKVVATKTPLHHFYDHRLPWPTLKSLVVVLHSVSWPESLIRTQDLFWRLTDDLWLLKLKDSNATLLSVSFTVSSNNIHFDYETSIQWGSELYLCQWSEQIPFSFSSTDSRRSVSAFQAMKTNGTTIRIIARIHTWGASCP